MMNTIFGFVVRVVLLLAGLIFMASLTGQPVRPWTFQVNRQAMWQHFYRQPGRDAAPGRDDSNVIDAEVKEIKEVREDKRPDS